VPFELESSTENDSRMLWRSWGGSLERLSFCDRPFETSLRGSRDVLKEADTLLLSCFWGEDSLWAVGDGGGSVCARL